MLLYSLSGPYPTYNRQNVFADTPPYSKSVQMVLEDPEYLQGLLDPGETETVEGSVKESEEKGEGHMAIYPF